jgi:hypothetical protein
LEEQPLEHRDRDPAVVLRLECRVELTALLRRSKKRLEAFAKAVDAGADRGVQHGVALLFAHEVRKDPGPLLDRA